MSSHSEPHASHDHGHHQVHISPTSTYLVILGALIVLTAATVLVSLYDLGWANDLVALGIAFTKATLVVLFFMHVKYHGRIIKLVVVSALAWLSVMMLLTYIDYGSRGLVTPDPQRVPSAFQEELDTGYEGAPAATATSGGHGDGAAATHDAGSSAEQH